MGEIIVLIILIGVASFMLKESFAIENVRVIDPVGADGFPRTILILLLILLVISLFKAIKSRRERQEEKLPIPVLIQFGGIVLAIAIFTILSDFIGFLFSAVFITLALLLILGERKHIRIIALVILLPIGFSLLFGGLLGVPLPRGIGFFNEISRFIY
ncbi:tripartite tricarboxylate transporter TctB family protein [Sporosarcina sp. 179-K 8C2 HS]|uniref:tripartite tricarboxylate transporter TctB family protein n=1 Tax=Sporosarcina sp. 179-K 8C2 HS TaxID=3142387 RepID=UPI00399FE53B